MSEFASLTRDIDQQADPVGAEGRARFFKTAVGDYGEGDQFLGLSVPAQRRIAKRYAGLELKHLKRLLVSRFHEYRFIALVILVEQYRRAPAEGQPPLLAFYLAHLHRVNNWDLVDASAPYILGEHLKTADDAMLDSLARSSHLWTRRVAIVATLPLIKGGNVAAALRVADLLLADTHDLIHKAVGWALREVGRVDRPRLLRFLKRHYPRLPRTTLRYAIEHLSPAEREAALTGRFHC